MRVVYLTGERVYLRAMTEDDKDHVVAWYATPFPVNTAFGEEQLKEAHQHVWDATSFRFAIVRAANDDVVGGAEVTFDVRDRMARFELRIAPWEEDGEELRADALQVLVPWLLDDHNMRRVDTYLGSDQHAAIAAAERLGMHLGVRLRQFWRRPSGRVDALIYQILNPHEEFPHA